MRSPPTAASDGAPRADLRTPVTLLTGFLGSGKTTLLNAALRDPSMTRTAVVVNEFGEIGVDHLLITSSDDTIVVLENGCLCCTVFGELVGALNRLYHAREAGETPPFDQVVIETSGLADPGPVLQAFLSEPTLEGLFRVQTVVATIDAINGEATLDEHAEAVRQAALADVLLVTKLDLLSPSEAAERRRGLETRLRRLNRGAAIRVAGEDDPAILLRADGGAAPVSAAAAGRWLQAEAYAAPAVGADAGHGHGHAHDDTVASFVLTRDAPTTRQALQLLLGALERHLGPRLLRVKGLVQVAEEPGRVAVIQGAQHLLHNVTWLDLGPNDEPTTRLVFITYGMPAGELEELVGMLDRIAQRTAAARARGAAAIEPPGSVP